MTDRSKQDVADDLQQWHDYERRIATLQRVVDTQEDYIRDLLDDDTSNDQIIRLIAQERNDLRAELDATRDRLARALEGERRAQQRLRKTDIRGLLALVVWKILRRA
jgi:predicted  nucleic acid-binding Zn-ribbon protein